MVGQLIDVVLQPVSIERLDGGDDVGVKSAPLLLNESPIGNVVGERMLEYVHQAGEQLCLVEKLCDLEMSEAAPELFFGELHNRLKQQKRHIHADYGSRLQQPLVLGRKSVNAGGEDCLGCCRDLQRLWRLHKTISTLHAGERFRLDQCPDALL